MSVVVIWCYLNKIEWKMVLSITLALNSGLCPKYHQLRSLRCFKLRWGFFSSCFYSFVFEPETLVLIIIFFNFDRTSMRSQMI